MNWLIVAAVMISQSQAGILVGHDRYADKAQCEKVRTNPGRPLGQEEHVQVIASACITENQLAKFKADPK